MSSPSAAVPQASTSITGTMNSTATTTHYVPVTKPAMPLFSILTVHRIMAGELDRAGKPLKIEEDVAEVSAESSAINVAAIAVSLPTTSTSANTAAVGMQNTAVSNALETVTAQTKEIKRPSRRSKRTIKVSIPKDDGSGVSTSAPNSAVDAALKPLETALDQNTIADLSDAVHRMTVDQQIPPFVPGVTGGRSTDASTRMPPALVPSSGQISTGVSSVGELPRLIQQESFDAQTIKNQDTTTPVGTSAAPEKTRTIQQSQSQSLAPSNQSSRPSSASNNRAQPAAGQGRKSRSQRKKSDKSSKQASRVGSDAGDQPKEVADSTSQSQAVPVEPARPIPTGQAQPMLTPVEYTPSFMPVMRTDPASPPMTAIRECPVPTMPSVVQPHLNPPAMFSPIQPNTSEGPHQFLIGRGAPRSRRQRYNSNLTPFQKLLQAMTDPARRSWVQEYEELVRDFIASSREAGMVFKFPPEANEYRRLIQHSLGVYFELEHISLKTQPPAVQLVRNEGTLLKPRLASYDPPVTPAQSEQAEVVAALPTPRIMMRPVITELTEEGSTTAANEPTDGGAGPRASLAERQRVYDSRRADLGLPARPASNATASWPTQRTTNREPSTDRADYFRGGAGYPRYQQQQQHSLQPSFAWSASMPPPPPYYHQPVQPMGGYGHYPYAAPSPMPTGGFVPPVAQYPPAWQQYPAGGPWFGAAPAPSPFFAGAPPHPQQFPGAWSAPHQPIPGYHAGMSNPVPSAYYARHYVANYGQQRGREGHNFELIGAHARVNFH